MTFLKKNAVRNHSKPATMCIEVKRNQQNIKDTQELKIIRAIEEKIIRDIINLLEQKKKKKVRSKPAIVGHFYSNNSIEYESSSDKNKALSIKENIDETESYLKAS